MDDHSAFLRRQVPDPAFDPLALPWRAGGRGHCTVVAQVGDGRYMLVGIMASAEIAALVAEAHNEQLSVYPGSAAANAAIRRHLAAVEREDSPAPRSA